MQRTVLITGCSSGFGHGAAKYFAERGWNVMATLRTPGQAGDLAQLAGVAVTRIDVTDGSSVRSGVAATLQRFGRIDVLVNNAGYGLVGPLEGLDEEQLRRQLDTNVLGLMLMTREVLPAMRAQRAGVIVNLSSIAGRICFPALSAYNASKWAVEGFSEALQYEVAPFGIRLKLIQPGAVKTPFHGRSMDHGKPPAAYRPLLEQMGQGREARAARMPGPERVIDAIYRAATDGTSCLRYPVHAAAMLTVRKLLGASGWRLLMNRTVARAYRNG